MWRETANYVVCGGGRWVSSKYPSGIREPRRERNEYSTTIARVAQVGACVTVSLSVASGVR